MKKSVEDSTTKQCGNTNRNTNTQHPKIIPKNTTKPNQQYRF